MSFSTTFDKKVLSIEMVVQIIGKNFIKGKTSNESHTNIGKKLYKSKKSGTFASDFETWGGSAEKERV